ncbi:tRNA threonylcarbamoyladenosine biosynthesis protein TsaB [Desulfacinum hydrothermale DSM 13146]|uniref:tRNA threonylcarbamoyladenosine biosynthesis protein TsaB n=1 Tax=Desulfacinum hydrothermale DSM 13146 TaxID=1121390 RepID=A0A1W1XNP6_9BACT|nr:tRNA (adenosine(37)-N6)-threonylcarbamoyltransferase complex dimerization subunit type 1 TsaB [Desulfacinum hydrothermale]SMC25138.1 tRNA threonylcarbamoyladenosine biosynthesis protein TsaB [Desulfacinum hydrothermale DSM 13146]
MKILAVDTSTLSGSVALCTEERVVAEWSLVSAQTHNRRLLAGVDRILGDAGWDLEEVDAFAVTVGPGSFTGIRIGLSTLKAMAWALGKPLCGVTTLEALAAPLAVSSLPVCPMVDARKKEIYAALYRPKAPEELIEERPPSALSPEAVLEWVQEPVWVCGDGWLEYGSMLRKRLGDRLLDPGPAYHGIRAAHVGRIALKKLAAGVPTNPAEIVPTYIRPSEAEINHPHLARSLA